MKHIYLIQHYNLPTELLTKILFNNKVDYLVLTYKEEINDEHFIYAPNTTWTTGRNLLLQSIDASKYDFIHFCDGDMILRSEFNDDSFIEYQKRCEQYMPYVAATKYSWHRHTEALYDKVITIDACFNTFRADKIDLFLPYNPKYDDISWWYSQLLIYDKFYTYGYDKIYQFNEFLVDNFGHSDYPKMNRFDDIIDKEFENQGLCFQDIPKDVVNGKINLLKLIIK
jgi:hypothetical protein